MSDPFIQREQDLDRQDEDYARWIAQERRDRRAEYAPQGPCDACGHFSVEVEPGNWLCACFTGYPA